MKPLSIWRRLSVSFAVLATLLGSAMASRAASAFPRSEAERDALPESDMHDKIRDRYPDLPDEFTAVAGERKIALYIGRGTWGAGKQHMKRMFRRYGHSYQAVTAKDIVSGKLDPAEFSLLAMPGGKSWKYLADLGSVGAENIRRFVSNGGGYMGFCAGAFFAVSHRHGPDPVEPYGIGLLDGIAYDGTSLRTRPFHKGMINFSVSIPGFKSHYKIILLGGPSFQYTPEEAASKHLRVLGRFPLIHDPAMITFNYGKGRVFLSGPHGEIEERHYLLGVIFHDPDSEWPFLNAMVNYLGGGEFPKGQESETPLLGNDDQL
jgi:glutamine amidotransferase-like uncharacterized protein